MNTYAFRDGGDEEHRSGGQWSNGLRNSPARRGPRPRRLAY